MGLPRCLYLAGVTWSCRASVIQATAAGTPILNRAATDRAEKHPLPPMKPSTEAMKSRKNGILKPFRVQLDAL